MLQAHPDQITHTATLTPVSAAADPAVPTAPDSPTNQPSAPFSDTTSTSEKAPDKQMSPPVGIIAGSVVGVIVLLAAVAVIVLIRRKRGSDHMDKAAVRLFRWATRLICAHHTT